MSRCIYDRIENDPTVISIRNSFPWKHAVSFVTVLTDNYFVAIDPSLDQLCTESFLSFSTACKNTKRSTYIYGHCLSVNI